MWKIHRKLGWWHPNNYHNSKKYKSVFFYKKKIIRIQKLRKLAWNFFFSEFLEKPSWRLLLGNCMQSFIELAWSESFKIWGTKILKKSKRYYFWNNFGTFQIHIKSKVFEFQNAVFNNAFVLPRRIKKLFGKGIAPLKSTLKRVFTKYFLRSCTVEL